MAVLRTETLLNTEYISKAGETCLKVELRALGQESWLAVIIKFEESGSTFNLSLNQAWRSNFDQRVFSKCVSES
jgi:hypothetical protein